jgi:hypothetical protein
MTDMLRMLARRSIRVRICRKKISHTLACLIKVEALESKRFRIFKYHQKVDGGKHEVQIQACFLYPRFDDGLE